MKKTVFLILFSACFFSVTFAQTKQESIKELLKLMKNDSASIKMMENMMPAIFAQNQQQMKDSATMAKAQMVMNIVMESVKGMIVQIQDDMVLLYDKYYTQKDIDELIAFYKSPIGRKLVETNPLITKDVVLSVFQKYIPELKKNMLSKMGEMKAPEKK